MSKSQTLRQYLKSVRGERSTKADRILYIIATIFSVLFLIFGYRYAVKDGTVLGQDLGGVDTAQYRAKIVEVVSSSDIYSQYSDSIAERRTVCYAELLDGPNKGKQILVTQVQDSTTLTLDRPCAVGDKLTIYQGQNEFGESQWFTINHIRSDWLYGLAIFFVLIVLLFGGMKGVRTILSLVFTCLAIFAVMIPLIAAGHNVYLCAILICIFTIVMTLSLVSGWKIKTLAAGIGCTGGVLIAGLITIISEWRLHMTGLVDDDAMLLLFINEETPIDLKGILFAAIIIGAVGATMDVGMDIASALTELSDKKPDIRGFELMRSGFTIGRDIMGTMSNTLVLAYIGSGLHVTLLFMTYYDSLSEVLNIEMITAEVLQALAGSIGIIFTIPMTTLASVLLFVIGRRRRKKILTKKVSAVSIPAAETEPAAAEPSLQPAAPAAPPRQLRRPEEVPFLRERMNEKTK